ncbi:MAG TPA: nitrate reductase associated protein [Cyclobacteriaceae bacterium]|nr:nitrate reductase associated protein [Cyclobacteriaceae bacterium]
MHFKFESDFVEPGIKCIPMNVRFKLDACGIKLKLAEWSAMTVAEREYFFNASCTSPDEISQFRKDLEQLVIDRTGNRVAEIPVDQSPSWSKTDLIPDSICDRFAEEGFPITLHVWQQLTDLQRFALLKLSRPGHESKNFTKAVIEFGLLKQHS